MGAHQRQQNANPIRRSPALSVSERVAAVRKKFIYLVVFLHAVENRPYRAYDDPDEDIFVGSLAIATRECIDAMMECEDQDLQWTGPPTFLGVAKMALRELVLDAEWPDWREMSKHWVYEHLDAIEEEVAFCVGVDKLW